MKGIMKGLPSRAEGLGLGGQRPPKRQSSSSTIGRKVGSPKLPKPKPKKKHFAGKTKTVPRLETVLRGRFRPMLFCIFGVLRLAGLRYLRLRSSLGD